MEDKGLKLIPMLVRHLLGPLGLSGAIYVAVPSWTYKAILHITK